jgi:hypothetical protein
MRPAVSRLPSKRGRDDGRDALRAAIARRAEAAAAVQDHKAALVRARGIIATCEKAVERAGRGIGEARSIHADLLAKTIVSGDDDLDGGAAVVKASRAVEVQALDELAAAKLALRRLQAQQTEVENRLALAGGNITVAINEMLAPLAREALEQLKKLDRQVAPRLGLLKWVLEIGTERGPRLRDDTVSELRMEEAIREPLEDVRRAAVEHFQRRITGDVESAIHAWAQARDDLRGNPDASLPGT